MALQISEPGNEIDKKMAFTIAVSKRFCFWQLRRAADGAVPSSNYEIFNIRY
jgi:hypothetical protein